MPAYVIATVTEAHDAEALAEYQEIAPIRQGASTTDIVLVQGAD